MTDKVGDLPESIVRGVYPAADVVDCFHFIDAILRGRSFFTKGNVELNITFRVNGASDIAAQALKRLEISVPRVNPVEVRDPEDPVDLVRGQSIDVILVRVQHEDSILAAPPAADVGAQLAGGVRFLERFVASSEGVGETLRAIDRPILHVDDPLRGAWALEKSVVRRVDALGNLLIDEVEERRPLLGVVDKISISRRGAVVDVSHLGAGTAAKTAPVVVLLDGPEPSDVLHHLHHQELPVVDVRRPERGRGPVPTRGVLPQVLRDHELRQVAGARDAERGVLEQLVDGVRVLLGTQKRGVVVVVHLVQGNLVALGVHDVHFKVHNGHRFVPERLSDLLGEILVGLEVVVDLAVPQVDGLGENFDRLLPGLRG
mmetsp:Transcript_34842/g.75403  ORF Transcript_34842/g.75403 Transcript_34842/m.75403 type:complete len:373 (+) Transcript_34842:824-1942(+)